MKSKFLLSKWRSVVGVALGVTMAANISMATAASVNTTGLAVTDKEVTVGILHSLTGTMAISETGAQEAEKLHHAPGAYPSILGSRFGIIVRRA